MLWCGVERRGGIFYTHIPASLVTTRANLHRAVLLLVRAASCEAEFVLETH